jgi:hypothetical protein
MRIRIWGSSGIYILICLYGLYEYYLCGFFLLAGMRVWVVYTHTRTRIPDEYKNSSNNVPAGTKCLPYPSSYRVKLVGYSGFEYPLPSWWPIPGQGHSQDSTSLLGLHRQCVDGVTTMAGRLCHTRGRRRTRRRRERSRRHRSGKALRGISSVQRVLFLW